MKVIEEQSIEYSFVAKSGNLVHFQVDGNNEHMYLATGSGLEQGGTPKEVAVHMRSLADNLIRVATKLEGIK